MSATVFGTARYGVVDEDTATGIKVADMSYAYSTEEAAAEDNLGCEFASAYYNDQTEVSASGVVAVKTAGLNMVLADVIVLANEDDDSLGLNDKSLFTTADANAGVVISSLDLTRTNRGFETGSMTGKFKPLVATNSPTVISS